MLSRIVDANSQGVKAAATKLGLTLSDYLAKRKEGLAHCSLCKQWHPASQVYRNNMCRPCAAAYARSRYHSHLSYRAGEEKQWNRYVIVGQEDNEDYGSFRTREKAEKEVQRLKEFLELSQEYEILDTLATVAR